jgi:hypothetical protein
LEREDQFKQRGLGGEKMRRWAKEIEEQMKTEGERLKQNKLSEY